MSRLRSEMAERVTIRPDAEITQPQAEEVAEAFRDAGMEPEFKGTRRYAGAVTPWAIVAALEVAKWLVGLAKEAGRDAAKEKVRRLARRVWGSRSDNGARPGALTLLDTATGVQILLEHDLPDEAYEQLLDLDLTQFSRTPQSIGIASSGCGANN